MKPFAPGDRIIWEGEYIGVLVRPDEELAGHWFVHWDDGAQPDHSFDQKEMVYANGGPASAQRGTLDAVFSPENLAHVVAVTGLSLQSVTEVARVLRRIA